MIRTLILLIVIVVAPVWCQDDVPDRSTWAKDGLPDAPGKDLTVQVCTGCHEAEVWSGMHLNGDAWDSTISKMVDGGLTLNETDYAKVLKYFSTYLGPGKPAVDVNMAESPELASTLGIAPALADAIVGYRARNGSFKDLDALKKVPGLDAAALDAKKDSIEF